MDHIETAARKFADFLLRDLGPDTLREVVRRNAEETDPLVCHTHDFCDANVDMGNAIEQVLGRELDYRDAAVFDLWSAAWALARAHNFFIEE